jgi:4-hydroxy-tetrahydrodipicolinate reductase
MCADKIKVLISGACGRMGQAVVKAVQEQEDMEIVALVDISDNLENFADKNLLNKSKNIVLNKKLKNALEQLKVDAAVDFTNPALVYEHTVTMIEKNVSPIIGTTGLTANQLQEIIKQSEEKNLGGMIAPNFAIGAVLMMQFAKKASEYFDHAEILELHHNKKLDAPSGTAIKTAELMGSVQKTFGKTNIDDKETLKGSRGGVSENNIHIHSVRLPGLVAHQEVYLAGPGQMLTIRHDSFDRVSFMPGVILAIRNAMSQNKIVYGLENIL